MTADRRAAPRARRACVAAVVTVVLFGVLLIGGASAATPTIIGSGADSADPLIGAWQKELASATPPTTVDYSADGAGAGREAFVGGEVDFTVTSRPFTSDEEDELEAENRTYASVPLAGGSLVFLYHLFSAQGTPIEGLRLSGPTLTKIFTGTVTNWNDAEIVAANPGVELPPTKIIPTVRGQAAGATYAATDYFRTMAPDVWKAFMEDPQRNFTDEPRELYPFFAGVDSRTSSFAVADVVRANEGSDGRIAYVDSAWAIPATDLGADILEVQNEAGEYVAPTAASTQKTLDAWDVDAEGHVTPDYKVNVAGGYPIPMVHEIVIPKTGLTAEKATALRTFVDHGLDAGQDAAATLGDPKLPDAVLVKSKETVAVVLPASTTTTTTTTLAPTQVSGSDLSASSDDSSSGDQLAYTGGPAVGWLAGLGASLVAAGSWLRRRRKR